MRCLLTYQETKTKDEYSKKGLRRLSPNLTTLHILPYSAQELRFESAARAGRISIQGVQPKLSAILQPVNEVFALVDQGGRYIIKPQTELYPQLPENEDLTMHLASVLGIEVPVHGLVRCKDMSLAYFIKRFDRNGKKGKVPLEDFAQLLGKTRDTKYDSSMEKVANVIDQFCTFPLVERAKLFERLIFNFIVGNEDMHLKNYSMICLNDRVGLAPAYDFLNSSIVLRDPEKIALPIAGKKKNLSRKNFMEFSSVRLGLQPKIIDSLCDRISSVVPLWFDLIKKSFLQEPLKERYQILLRERLDRLSIKYNSHVSIA